MDIQKSNYRVGASVLTLILATAGAALAQETSPEAGTVGEVIVTATRRSENLQDVPVTVTALSARTLDNLNITQFRDIQAISPGLVMEDRGEQGDVTALRGISTTVVTSSPPAVVFYFNEVPILDGLAFKSIYDIGQIEVVRGPQGTLRGVAAPAGAITIGTRRPDLGQVGGYVDATYTDMDAINGQLALNMPIIQDKLAVRVAGLYDRNRNGDVRNPTTGAESKARTKSIRASALFEPSDALSIFGSYQYMTADTDTLALVEGPGLGFNGPPIGSGLSGMAVQEQATPRRNTSHIASLNAKLDIGEQGVLSYIGGYWKSKDLTRADEGDSDAGNAILNYSSHGLFSVPVDRWSHEVRFDSAGANRFWDYTVGAYYDRTTSDNQIQFNAFALPTGFAPPTGPASLSVYALIENGGETTNKSVFASSTFHLPARVDLTVGARRIWVKGSGDFFNITTFTVIPGVGEFPDPTTSFPPNNADEAAWVYDAKLVQHLNDDSMIYLSYGRGYRGPGGNRFNAVPAEVAQVASEKQDSYEAGFKGAFFDRRLRLNAAVFQQDIDGYISAATDVPYCAAPSVPGPATCTAQSTLVVFNGDAQVRGFDLELFGQVTDRWTASGTLSYAKAAFNDGQVPCRPDLNGDGNPDTNIEFQALATQPIYYCASNGPISDVPKWNATLQSEYAVPMGAGEGYLRGLFVYKGKRQDVSGANAYEAQSILSLYLGARELAPGLDVTLFAKNILDDRKLTNTGAAELTLFGAYPTGYTQVNYTPAREIGVSVRKSFGAG